MDSTGGSSVRTITKEYMVSMFSFTFWCLEDTLLRKLYKNKGRRSTIAYLHEGVINYSRLANQPNIQSFPIHLTEEALWSLARKGKVYYEKSSKGIYSFYVN